MKKIITLCAVLTLVASLPAFALNMTPDVAAKVPATYAKVKDGNVVYVKKATAYSPSTLNAILEAYGLKLDAANIGNTPVGYAKASDDKITFGNKSTAYSPTEMDKIFKAYGLTLSPEDAAALLGSVTYYAKVKDGSIVLGDKSTAYSGDELSAILAAYKAPYTETVTEYVPPADTTPETPVPPTDTDVDGIPDDKDVCPGTPKGAVIDERGCWVLSQDYLFDFDKSVLKAKYMPVLDDVIKVINDNPGLRVELEGHTDSIGTEAYNMKLSQRRAKAVYNYLIKNGVEASRLSTVGYGESRPVASNASREDRAKNRRVELNPIW